MEYRTLTHIVKYGYQVPPDMFLLADDYNDFKDPDVRVSQEDLDKEVEKEVRRRDDSIDGALTPICLCPYSRLIQPSRTSSTKMTKIKTWSERLVLG